jgi:hypothetical protein
MKTVNRVYSNVTPYHSAKHFNIEMPAEQATNETNCKTTRQPSVEEADDFGRKLWGEAEPVPATS